MSTSFPKCFNSKQQYYGWCYFQKLVHILDKNNKAAHYCDDCTKQYQKQMTVVGRCLYPNREILQ